jgi:hypothetical protein
MSTNRSTVAPYPWLQQRIEGLWDQTQNYINNTPYAAYPGGSRVAGFSPFQLQAQQYLQSNLGAGTGEAQQAAGIAGGIAQGGNIPQVNPMMLGAQQAGYAGDVDAQQVQAGNLLGGINMYRDPYEDQVVGSALSDIDRSRQLAQVGNASGATMAGAFGGDRHAIVEGETNRAYADQAARTAAQLRSQGFSRAADLAQSDALRGLQAGMANQGAGLQAGMANQGARNAMGQFNAGLGMQAGLANQGAGLQAGMANQGAYFTGQGQQLQGAGLLGSLGGDIYNRTMGTTNMLSQMGQQQQSQSQAELSDDVSRFYEERDYPWEQIAKQQSLLEGFPAGMTTTQNNPFNWGSALTGGAMLGYGLFGPGGALNGGGGPQTMQWQPMGFGGMPGQPPRW